MASTAAIRTAIEGRTIEFVHTIDSFYMPLPEEGEKTTVGPLSYEVDGVRLMTPMRTIHRVKGAALPLYWIADDSFRAGEQGFLEVYSLGNQRPAVEFALNGRPLQVAGTAVGNHHVVHVFKPERPGKLTALVSVDGQPFVLDLGIVAD